MDSNQPIHHERHIRIICIGAGVSGLLFAYKLQRSFSNFSLVIYEKNPEIAGTWFENRYPGCACDVPSHNYTWSFEPKPDWSASYASSKEIFDYFDTFSRKYGLRHYCRVLHQVVGAKWNAQGGYNVRVRDLQSGKEWNDSCDILINAGGILNSWRWPAIPGLDRYKGTLVHTANWDDSISLEGKHVGLIGNGSSGIQVLPAVLPEVKKVTTFIREPTWVSPVKGLEQHIFTEEEKKAFASNPGHLTEYRRGIESGMNGQFAIFLRNTEGQRSTREYMTQQMREKLSNAELDKVLIPEWSVGCRRITPGVGYLESLSHEKVKVVYGNITEASENGCICDDGNEYAVDILICATGFDTSFRPRFPIIGPGGNNLQDAWKDEPHSYFGIAAAGIPNYLTFLGPNSPVGNGPVLSAIEAQADYMMKLIDRYQTTNIHSFAPKHEAVTDFIQFKDAFMRRTVWADGCRSWYKSTDPNGPVTGLWPGSTLHYIEAMNEVRFDDWEVKYNGNRFAWLGNGYSQTEIDETADWAYYIRDHDDGQFHSRNKRLRIVNKSGTRRPEKTAFTVFPRI
ncbi:flavin-containing monooxygenase [Aspergillus mulundensis]|uniref:FAD/NAD(P)-binding domain-containing protein n=1 Tax=Aspergillus mulundensis TaxID=1810919 RepID=A0A3D8QV46_9EURO|nr:Uncharacterized protein DSM5745_09384 [Aspergillus mulundensis]RDW65645.1 Uncharacterized protein DSM5745_09384 [Aspergillus mulundensis]